MLSHKRFRAVSTGLALIALIACDNAEDRANSHYKRGMNLLEAGETEKAILEFKNALQLNQEALEPRLEFARLLEAQGNAGGATGNYLKVVELDPNHLEARIALSRLMLRFNEAEAASEHLKVALAQAPDDMEVRALDALMAQQEERLEDAAAQATAILDEAPGNTIAVGILVTQKMAAEDYTGAITLLDDALEVSPEELGLHIGKLRALEALNDQVGIGAQLEKMAVLFPDDPQVAQGQVQWFINQGDKEGAIGAQRNLASIFSDDPSHALNVVSLINQYEGADAATAELEALVASGAHRVTFARAFADFEYQQKKPDAAISRLDLLLGTELEEKDKHDIQTQLANFLRDTGNAARSIEIVGEVLEENPDNLEGLKLRALHAIDNDRPQEAITDLRTALGAKAQDPQTLMLLALAHERNGSVGLAQERLALAVQASNVGIRESLAYAEFLTRHDKIEIARGVMDDALSKRGEVTELLAGLGQVQVQMSDWSGAMGTVRRLKVMEGDPRAPAVARDLELAVLDGEQKFERSIGILREMWDAAGERSSAMENLVRNYVKSGRIEAAEDFLKGVLEDDPSNLRGNLLRGALHVFKDEQAEAEAIYRKVIKEHPNVENGYGALASLLSNQGRLDEADQVTQAGIDNSDNTERLMFARASRLEQEGDFEGAIAIYEQLYAANKVSDVLANNLASLLSEFREDPESLERAFNIAKRLRSSDVPAFQDTYGWILYKRGEFERALQPLLSAAEGVPNNVFVQYHLGMVYEKLGQKDLAIETLERAVELGRGMKLPILEDAGDVLFRLQNN